ncbi:MAG: hypothetical protein KC478_06410, partial [Bacteriovoracaceae bacterium]|nr:hypothetical protein [Bacteriovoracaceae bacterium]
VIATIFLISSCASSKYSDVVFVDSAPKNCYPVSSLRSTGVSLVPGVGRMIAKSMLKAKAKEYSSNTIVIDSEDGTFQVDLEATGYNCINK